MLSLKQYVSEPKQLGNYNKLACPKLKLQGVDEKAEMTEMIDVDDKEICIFKLQ